MFKSLLCLRDLYLEQDHKNMNQTLSFSLESSDTIKKNKIMNKENEDLYSIFLNDQYYNDNGVYIYNFV